MRYTVEKVDTQSREALKQFLQKHQEWSLFLLGNLESYGMDLGTAPYSGNFKVIKENNRVMAAFCLTKNGSLLMQTEEMEPVFPLILDACKAEKIPIRGLVGKWDFSFPFWEFLKKKRIIQKETFASKEILYSLNLRSRIFKPFQKVKLLEEKDLESWRLLQKGYREEQGLPEDLKKDEQTEHFLNIVRQKIIWGYFEKDRLVSMAHLNAKAGDIAQLGGVYTDPSFRKKGFCKQVLQHSFYDLTTFHKMEKLIIFTGDHNTPARRLYESLGSKARGHYALLFGKGKS